MKTNVKIILVAILVVICLIVTYYFHFIYKTQVVFTHLFYIPIVISSIYWKRAGVFVSVFLGGILIISQIVSSLDFTAFDLVRSIMFVVVAMVITIITNINNKIKVQLKYSEEFVKLNKELMEANELLQHQNKQVIESEAQLRVMNTTRDKLFSIIAHDLRSPFSSILGISELIKEDFETIESAKLEKHIDSISTSTKDALVLLDNLLNWAVLQNGQITVNFQKINLTLVIEKIIESSMSISKVKNISLSFDQSTDVDVYTDENMLRTILRNLISNAVKFSYPAGSVNIIVTTTPNFAEISISDHGIGINEEMKKNLFGLTTHISTIGTAKEKGSGLGLVLCKEFVEKLGGTIWVETSERKGSNFKFTLPLYEEK